MAAPKQSVHYPSWLTVGMAAIILLSLGTAFQSYRSVDAGARADPDPYMINVQPQRLQEAIPYLPERGQVGYLSDLSFEVTAGSAAYFGVMNALAPRLVTRSADRHEWVVGNFSHPLDFVAAGLPHHLEIVRDFGNGIVLFRRRAQ
jgi:hypothetical protein